MSSYLVKQLAPTYIKHWPLSISNLEFLSTGSKTAKSFFSSWSAILNLCPDMYFPIIIIIIASVPLDKGILGGIEIKTNSNRLKKRKHHKVISFT